MANLKNGTVVAGSITGDLTGNADTATAIKYTKILASTNLNSLTTPGVYICNNNDSPTITNKPPINTTNNMSNAFSLHVESTGGGIRQIFYSARTDMPYTCIRNLTDTTWTKWYNITGV